MFKVMIAEDEFLVRIGLKNSINWERFQMVVSADVDNGEEAWQAYLRDKPDLIIT
ncbi:MAG: DNA-binding response regulator, partial [Gorillibacterium sp.]|nr:DNA-binding response regulator [Gorillibacterium sp.]